MAKYNVKADHPVLRRPDRYNISEEEKNELVTELERLGYENIKVEEVNTKLQN